MEAVVNLTFSNDVWIAGLKEGRGDLIATLRARIRRGLTSALASRSDVSDADLDDFAQNAVIRILERLETFRGESSFLTWAMAVAVRVSLTELRRRVWAEEPLDERLEELARPEQSGLCTGAVGELAELLAVLRGAIADALTPRQRQVLLGELDGISQVVLAERLGSTPGAIYKTSHDARKKLKAALERQGFDARSVRETLANQR